ncbi:hypothetical protein [Bdellovibrio bacteriovorus]|uniref:hypothetical protein n=1 Tax=Bdellovibrio bacteriovorus TaxID=959 RepID=UPI00059F2E92|nr:hypothetical protein [Bdellovibrio bacteriovorus]
MSVQVVLNPDELCFEIQSKFNAMMFQDVKLDVVKYPFDSSKEDYTVAYSLRFVPSSLNQLQLEIWITDMGCVGVGVETWSRVLRRLGRESSAVRFVVGHEPADIPKEAIFRLIDLISLGKFTLKSIGIEFLKLNSFNAYLAEREYKSLRESGYRYLAFVKPCKKSPAGRKVLEYIPWE